MFTLKESAQRAVWSAVVLIGLASTHVLQVHAQADDHEDAVANLRDESSTTVSGFDVAPAGTLSPQDANLIQNPGFESGTASWSFYANGSSNFSIAGPAYTGSGAGRVTVNQPGTNIQLYQVGIGLLPDTTYEISFAARSNTGHDLEVSIGKFGSPYTNYGLLPFVCDLTDGWAVFSTSFRTANFTSPVNDARLQFWLVPYAAAADEFWIDDVTLSMVGGVTSVAEGKGIPEGFVLEQNFPNPFNPATRIRYALGTATQVQLTVHDVVGREVLRPVDGFQDAGYHEIHIVAGDLASGVYFYRITTPEFTQAKRMILVK
ncbi:MAG: carbohydrate binding domain-containing protein [Ignavibacteria bacterium]|nr:carbohydrate binding domain-containing protein [Ignavibacteria bacterium]